jgi:AraC-like DNA-binding protein
MKAPEHYHEDYMEIQVVLNGELKETIDNIPVKLKAGDLCFVAPHATHNPFVTDSETLVYCMVVPYQTLYRAFPRFTAFKSTIYTFISRFLYSSEYQPMLVCPTGSDPVIYEILLAAVREAEEDSPYIKELLFNHLQAIILYLLKDHEQDFIIAHTTKADHRNMDHIITYIRQNYNSVTLPALSEKFGYSESYLSTMIRKSTGTTFQQFLMDLRLEHAALALKNTDTEVASIITSVGYREKSHFYRIFKKKYGISPTEYRDLSRRITPSSKDGRD